MQTYSQLCKEQRNIIEDLLNKNFTFTEIGKSINVDRRTISREVKRNRIIKSSLYLPFSNNGIGKATKMCDKLSLPPYCCNNCPHRSSCTNWHIYYNAKEAQKHYEEVLISSREGIDMTPEDINLINKNIIPLIKDKHQSVNQVYINHPDILWISKPTFYKYVDLHVINLKNSDLPRKVKYKKRKNNKNKISKRERALLIGRTYEDYVERISKDKTLIVWQLDTVIGRRNESKVLMTFLLVNTNFMIIRILDKCNVEQVDKEFTILKQILGIDVYKEIINIILTDNGGEFYDPVHMEYDLDTGEEISSVYYCHPNSPEEKAELEKNHEYIRYVLPKRTSFQNLTKEQVQKLEDNINNIPREILGDKTPYELTKKLYPNLIKKLNAKYIKPDNVTLNPKDILGDDNEK